MANEPIQPPSKEWPSILVREPLQPGSSGVGVSLEVETIEPKLIDKQYVYSAKFLCGKIPHNLLDPQEPARGFPLVPGTYRTAINIHNPNLNETKFLKLALTTNPQGQPRGKAGAPVAEVLGPNEGLEVDCDNIEELLTTGSGVDLFNNTNVDAVFNNPPSLTTFPLSVPTVIRQLITYHWNNGQGDQPGTIALRDQSGTFVIPPTPAQGTPGQGGVPNANWIADVHQLVQPGTYTVIDSKPQTWSYNQQSLHAGFAIVRGSHSFVGRAPFFKGFVVIRCPQLLDVVGVYTLKNVISSAPNPPTPAEGRCPPINVRVSLAPDRDTYHLHDIIGITADIGGGQPPYSPVTVTLTSRDLRAPYSIESTSAANNHFATSWQVYLVGPPPVPGTWGQLNQCTITVSVTDANGCKGTGTSRPFTLMNP